MAKYMLNGKLIDIFLTDRADIEASVAYTNPAGKNTIWYSVIEKTLMVDCENKPRDKHSKGIEWMEVEWIEAEDVRN